MGRQLNVVAGPTEAALPKNVGLLFFNEQPDKFFPATQIDVVWFSKEGPGGDKFSEKIFRGHLPRMTSDALDYIRRNFISDTVIKNPDKPESTRVKNFPYEAVEEAIVNAVYHRGYDVREPVEVRISPQELVVLSYSGPDRSVRLEQLRLGRTQPRRYRNRRIGEFLKELELTEGRFTGIPKILNAMKQNGSPPAEFEFDEDYSYFMVRLPVHPTALEVAESVVAEDMGTVSQLHGSAGAQSRARSGAQSKQIMIALLKAPLSMNELVDALGLKSKTGSLKRTVNELLHEEIIEYTLPKKPTSRLQKYRLTKMGLQALGKTEKSK